MSSFLIIIIYSLMTTGTMVMLSRKSFGICFVPAVILSTISMYFSQMVFRSFFPGMILNLLFAILFPVLLLREKNRILIKDGYFTYGFVLFLAIAFSLVIVDHTPQTYGTKKTALCAVITYNWLDSFTDMEANGVKVYRRTWEYDK